MLQIAAPIWNQISPMASSPQWRHLFSLSQDEQIQAMDKLDAQLVGQGVDPAAALAYQQLAPLLQERRAIRAFLKTNPQWTSALPEVLSTNEAILMAVKDHRLKVSQTRALRKLLDGPPPTI